MTMNIKITEYFKNLSYDISNKLKSVLNNLQDDDFFGTEGQNDPRGDFRDCFDECPKCKGEGCEECEEGFIDKSDEMRLITKENFDYIIANILELPEEDIEKIYNELTK